MQESPAPLVTAAGAPRMEIGTLSVTAGEKKAAPPPAPEMTSEQAKTDADANNAEAQAQAKKRAEDAGKLLKEYHIEPRVVLRLLTDGEAVAGTLEEQAQSEIETLKKRNDLGPEQKQKLAGAINERYRKLIQYSENREESIRKQIKKLEASQKPEDKALLLDVSTARAQIEKSVYQEKVNQIELILKTQQLDHAVIDKYEAYKEELNKKIIKTEDSILDLKKRRDEIKRPDGKTVPNIIEEMAIAVTGGEANEVKNAQKNPVEYIKKAIVNALTTEGGVAKLADNLVKATILGDADKAKFIKDMELGLTSEDIMKITKSIAGKTALGLAGLLSMLGYVALQRRLKENTAS